VKRREFITLLGGAATWPLAARAQQAGKLPTIGFLGSASASSWSQWAAAFVRRLHELDWIEGRTVAIEFRWADGHSERFAEIASEFIRLKVDIIVTSGTAAPAAKQATSVIPIVFAVAVDPLGTGLVESLARPGGNVTGLSLQQPDATGKRLELLREIVPGLRRLAILANRGYPAAVVELGEVQKTAHTFGFEVLKPEIRRTEDIALAFDALRGRADAVYVCSEPLVNANRVPINTLALAARLPTMHGNREYVEARGLISYGPNFPALWRRAAEMVDKILRGAKPADIPVEQPTKFELVINLKTANMLGLKIPTNLLALADEVIE
jgi:putative ABC transport system substrate-binding protein